MEDEREQSVRSVFRWGCRWECGGGCDCASVRGGDTVGCVGEGTDGGEGGGGGGVACEVRAGVVLTWEEVAVMS